ncbi:MAG: hypothetical protein AAGN64_02740 [Bacteroidota bacterium]
MLASSLVAPSLSAAPLLLGAQPLAVATAHIEVSWLIWAGFNALVVGRGTAEDLDPILLSTKSGIGALVEAGPDADPADHPVLQGWRREIVGADLLRVLRGEAAVLLDADGLPSRCVAQGRLAAGS